MCLFRAVSLWPPARARRALEPAVGPFSAVLWRLAAQLRREDAARDCQPPSVCSAPGIHVGRYVCIVWDSASRYIYVVLYGLHIAILRVEEGLPNLAYMVSYSD